MPIAEQNDGLFYSNKYCYSGFLIAAWTYPDAFEKKVRI
jgi:hypothetical protein